MTLESKRLKLEEVSWADVTEIHLLHSFDAVAEYNTLPIPKSIEETKGAIKHLVEAKVTKPRKFYLWKIVLKSTGAFVGIAGMTLSLDQFSIGEIYYKLMPSFWGKGFATEVSKRLIKSGFEDFKLHRIEAGVDTENIASIRVLEKSGMTREGRRRKILPIRGKWRDNFHYAILEDDPPIR
ncbi:GNAT family protein [Flagellimonas sp. DF-77]|uniref:GNAT family N-acetyltransferase n=1 Tax=Flagellimonas algarum TaxID=3230298 RepID=UPI0033919ACE